MKQSEKSTKKYLFSVSDKNFYYAEMDYNEMNNNDNIKLLIANTAYRAGENYKKIDKEYQNNFKEYQKEDKLPDIKDSNIKKDDMKCFAILDEDNHPVSVIIAGIYQEPLRIMMGTIDTEEKYQGKGYFSILFDEVVCSIAEKNNNILPQIMISERGITSKGSNFDTYLAIMNGRKLSIYGLEREVNPEKEFIDHNIDKKIFSFSNDDDKEKFKNEKSKLKEKVLEQKNEAFFLYGIPDKITFEDFIKDKEQRVNDKIKQGNIFKKDPENLINNPSSEKKNNNKII